MFSARFKVRVLPSASQIADSPPSFASIVVLMVTPATSEVMKAPSLPSNWLYFGPASAEVTEDPLKEPSNNFMVLNSVVTAIRSSSS